jgi:death-on-curing protein
MKRVEYLTAEEILRLHFQVVNDYGGPHGLRSEERLLSVVEAPKQIAFGLAQYKTVHEKAAVYMRNIIGDHPFIDGNKRTGVTSAAIFLIRNGYKLTAIPKQLEDFAIKIATKHLDIAAISNWLKQHTQATS